MDQLQLDYQLKAVIPDAIAGVEYTVYGQKYMYKGTDVIHKQSEALMRDHPELHDAAVTLQMLKDPLGYKRPPFQLDPNIVKGVAVAAAAGKLAELSGMADAVKSLVPGLSAPLESLKGTIGGLTDKLPIKALGPGSIAIPGAITSLKATMDTVLKGPTSAIAMAMKGGLLSDVAAAAAGAAGAAAGAVSLASQAAGMAKAMSSGNPVAIASAAAGMASKFPMINPNAMASQMLGGVLSGSGFDIASKIPNMSAMAGGLTKMLPIPGKLPTMDAVSPIKTAAPPKPVTPIELKNLFAEGAASGGISDLTKPLSQAMGLASTVASAAGVASSLLASSAAVTSAGTQKLSGNANTVNWGSGGYGRDTSMDEITKKRLNLTAKIDMHSKELDAMCEPHLKTLYSLPYSELISRYPKIKPTTPVAEALQIIADVDAALALKQVNIS
jgi:hypothetical protein